MPTALIYFDEEENEIIIKVSKELKVSKQDAVKQMVRSYGEDDGQ